MSVFVSYRRVDADAALIVYGWLRDRFGRDGVFWDAEDIPASAPWASEIRESVRSAAALVVVIGPGWAELRNDDGSVRLESEDDWVRREVMLALEIGLPIFPVVSPGAELPSEASLPEELRGLLASEAIFMDELKARRKVLDALEQRVPVEVEPQLEDRTLDRLRWLLERQVQRLQIRGVELVQEGHADRAREELEEGSQLLLELVALTPMNLQTSAQLGYLYGSMADTLDKAGDEAGSHRYVDLARAVFSDLIERVEELIQSDEAPDAYELRTATNVAASSLNGLGAILRRRGRLSEAIDIYRKVVALAPRYAYAWHDLVAVLLDSAAAGDVRVEEMIAAVVTLKQVVPGHPGISAEHLAGIEQRVRKWAMHESGQAIAAGDGRLARAHLDAVEEAFGDAPDLGLMRDLIRRQGG